MRCVAREDEAKETLFEVESQVDRKDGDGAHHLKEADWRSVLYERLRSSQGEAG